MQHASKSLILLAKSLQRRRHRYAERLILVEGEKVVAEALDSGISLKVLLATPSQYELALSLTTEDKVFAVTEEEMKSVSTMDTPPGLVAITKMPESSFQGFAEKKLLACFVNASDPGNLGTMIRTADWFGVEGIILTESTVDPYNPKVVRSAMGSLFHLPIYQSEDLGNDLQALRDSGIKLVATDAHGTENALPEESRLCIMMGSESHGLPSEYQALADHTYTIPKHGKAESLNVAMSFGITLYSLTNNPQSLHGNTSQTV
ncbi:MAG: methyltransferase [Patescibacteria group bacterium]|jgi:TrmH family RNA methyltransferase|nr:methyltransferase [Patescibacteria group bacterium]